jgi:hypothetical protein
MIETSGRYENIPMGIYHGPGLTPTPSASRGTLRDLLYLTPAHVKQNNPDLNPDYKEDTDEKYSVGKLGHSLFLEGIDCCAVIDPKDYPAKNGNVPDGWTNKDIRAARDEAIKEGKIPMLPDQYGEVIGMVSAAKIQLAASDLNISSLATEGKSEVTYVWQENGIWCRARLDWISNDRAIILDPKFTGQLASPWQFERQIEPMGLDIQYAWYTRAVEAVEGIKPKVFVFWVVETEPPYLACPISLNPQYIEMGREKIKLGLSLWKKFLKENHWPGYPLKVCYLEPKAWALTSWEERRFAIEIDNQREEDKL